MEFRHLRCFVAVAEELSFTRAAERIHIVQPALSRVIQQLENEIGARLFVRDRNHVFLSPLGKAFLPEARKVVAQMQLALERVRPSQSEGSRVIRIAMAAGLAEQLVPAFTQYGHAFPQVELQCNDMLSTPQNEALRNRFIDVGFLRPPIDSRYLRSALLFREPLMLLASRKSRFAHRKKVRIVDLAHETLLLHERRVSIGVYDTILQLFRKAGITPHTLQTKTGPYEEAGTMLVASGKGIFLVPGSGSYRAFNHDVVALAVDDCDAIVEVHIVWRRDEMSSSVNRFVESMRLNFSNAQDGSMSRSDNLPDVYRRLAVTDLSKPVI